MNEERQKRLEQKGWKIGSVKDFLELSAQEMEQLGQEIKGVEDEAGCHSGIIGE